MFDCDFIGISFATIRSVTANNDITEQIIGSNITSVNISDDENITEKCFI